MTHSSTDVQINGLERVRVNLCNNSVLGLNLITPTSDESIIVVYLKLLSARQIRT